jgi:L-threonylcarbamoyladenylate synthase
MPESVAGPKVITLNGSNDAAAIDEAVSALERGELVVVPTETVYGVIADPRLPNATESIYAAKQRDRGKPLQMLVTGVDDIEAMGFNLSDLERRLAERFWPGGITMVVRSDEVSEGFRVPDSEVVIAIARRLGGALRATSANLSGEPPATTAQAAMEALGDSVAVVLDGGHVRDGVASTVLLVDDQQRIDVLREGVVSRDKLKEIGDLRV